MRTYTRRSDCGTGKKDQTQSRSPFAETNKAVQDPVFQPRTALTDSLSFQNNP